MKAGWGNEAFSKDNKLHRMDDVCLSVCLCDIRQHTFCAVFIWQL